MIKPNRLKIGDTVALVSLSSGIAGEKEIYHRVELAVKRLEEEFGLKVKIMPNALKGITYLDKHPEARAKDLMDAFESPEIKAIICMIGGDDTIRLLPYIDFDIIKNNPKIFMGYSDTTVNHFMMYYAGIHSFYGPAVLSEFAENAAMHEYTKQYIRNVLFDAKEYIDIPSSSQWTAEMLDWSIIENDAISRKMISEKRGYQFLQGKGRVQGKLLGGCIDVFPMIMGTKIWPKMKDWKDSILFIETSEENPSPTFIKRILRGFVAQDIIGNLSGIVIGKPKDEVNFEEYKNIILEVIVKEAGYIDIPILYNMNFGHNAPMTILPYGILAEIDCEEETFKLCESAVQ